MHLANWMASAIIFAGLTMVVNAVPVAQKAIGADKGKQKLKVEIKNAKVTINGKVVPLPGDLSAFEKVLGKPSGSIIDPVSDKNRYVFWNALGIRCSQDVKGEQKVQEIMFELESFYDSSAKKAGKTFPGDLFVEGVQITKATTKSDVKKIKGREVFGSWRIEYEGNEVHVHINPSMDGTESVRVEVPLIMRQ